MITKQNCSPKVGAGLDEQEKKREDFQIYHIPTLLNGKIGNKNMETVLSVVIYIWIHKSISNKIDHYKFWNDRIIETRLKTQRGHLTILGVYALTEGRDELNEEFNETLQKYWIK